MWWILHILLLLLKIIGILLLVVLGVVLVVVLLVLFGAIRYQVEGKAENRESANLNLMETMRVHAKVSWLNPFFRIFVKVEGKKVIYQVKIFGFCLLDSENPKSKKKTTSATKPKPSVVQEEKPTQVEDKPKEETVSQETPKPKEEAISQETPKPEVQSEQNQTQQNASTEQSETVEETPKKKKKLNLEEIKAKVQNIKHKKDVIVSFLHDAENKHTIARALQMLKKMLFHILPVSLTGTFVYGSSDPASTGKAFAILGIFYAKYGESITIVPDFEEKRLFADFKMKGRIRLGVLVGYFLWFLLKKETFSFIKKCKQLVNEVKQ